jgi:hypothetical protein
MHHGPRKIRLFGREIGLPQSRAARLGIGIGLVGLGLLGFLPVLGFWMVPLGLLVLSVDIPAVRRFRRKVEVKWGRWRQSRQNARGGETGQPATGPSGVRQNREYEPDET